MQAAAHLPQKLMKCLQGRHLSGPVFRKALGRGQLCGNSLLEPALPAAKSPDSLQSQAEHCRLSPLLISCVSASFTTGVPADRGDRHDL